MRSIRWVRLALIVLATAGLGACRKFPTQPSPHWYNHNPVVRSVIAFPQVIGQGDSVLITVFADDPDGDSLVYDWGWSGQLESKNPRAMFQEMYNQPDRSQVFYRSESAPGDSLPAVWIDVRDSRGGSASAGLFVHLRS